MSRVPSDWWDCGQSFLSPSCRISNLGYSIHWDHSRWTLASFEKEVAPAWAEFATFLAVSGILHPTVSPEGSSAYLFPWVSSYAVGLPVILWCLFWWTLCLHQPCVRVAVYGRPAVFTILLPWVQWTGGCKLILYLICTDNFLAVITCIQLGHKYAHGIAVALVIRNYLIISNIIININYNNFTDYMQILHQCLWTLSIMGFLGSVRVRELAALWYWELISFLAWLYSQEASPPEIEPIVILDAQLKHSLLGAFD